MIEVVLVRPPSFVELTEPSSCVAVATGGIDRAIVGVVNGAECVIMMGRVLIPLRATDTRSCGGERQG